MLDLFGNHIVGFPKRRLIYEEEASYYLWRKTKASISCADLHIWFGTCCYAGSCVSDALAQM